MGRFVQRRDYHFPVYFPIEWLIGQAGGESDITPLNFPDRFWELESNKPPDNQPFVAILGLHSSGSSALAGVLWSLGVYLGDDLGGYYGSQPGYECGYEDKKLTDICETLIPFPSVMPAIDRVETQRLRNWIDCQKAEARSLGAIAGGKYPQLCQLGDLLQLLVRHGNCAAAPQSRPSRRLSSPELAILLSAEKRTVECHRTRSGRGLPGRISRLADRSVTVPRDGHGRRIDRRESAAIDFAPTWLF